MSHFAVVVETSSSDSVQKQTRQPFCSAVADTCHLEVVLADVAITADVQDIEELLFDDASVGAAVAEDREVACLGQRRLQLIFQGFSHTACQLDAALLVEIRHPSATPCRFSNAAMSWKTVNGRAVFAIMYAISVSVINETQPEYVNKLKIYVRIIFNYVEKK